MNKLGKFRKSSGLFLEWQRANIKFLEDEYGKENIVKLELHRDEKTPHFHAIVVPLTKDGRLSAKEVVGDRKIKIIPGQICSCNETFRSGER